MFFRRALIISTALLVTGCATTTPGSGEPMTFGDVAMAGAGLFLGAMVQGDPNRTVTTVRIGRETHTVTTHTSADGRKATVRVD